MHTIEYVIPPVSNEGSNNMFALKDKFPTLHIQLEYKDSTSVTVYVPEYQQKEFEQLLDLDQFRIESKRPLKERNEGFGWFRGWFG